VDARNALRAPKQAMHPITFAQCLEPGHGKLRAANGLLSLSTEMASRASA